MVTKPGFPKPENSGNLAIFQPENLALRLCKLGLKLNHYRASQVL